MCFRGRCSPVSLHPRSHTVENRATSIAVCKVQGVYRLDGRQERRVESRCRGSVLFLLFRKLDIQSNIREKCIKCVTIHRGVLQPSLEGTGLGRSILYKRLYWARNCVHIGAFQVFLHDLFQLMSQCLVFLGWSLWKQNSLWLVAWALVPTW